MRPSALLLVAALGLACVADTTEPPKLIMQPRFSSEAPPAELPNVFRYNGEAMFGVSDPNTDLWAFAGWPADFSQLERCGGPGAHFDTFYIQEAGQLSAVIHQIVKGDDVRIVVYRLSTFDFCTSQPVAVGTGSVSWHDSDFNVSGTRTETYGTHIDGTVTLTDGTSAKLTARNLWHVYPDGTTIRVYRNVTMRPN